MAWDGNPEQLVRDEFLFALMRPMSANPLRRPGVTLTLPDKHDHNCDAGDGFYAGFCFTGAILKDGDLIYRIGKYDWETKCWHARWPD